MIKYLALALLLAASAAHAEIYTWRAGGTDYYTNSLDEIPARYLKKARVLDVATGKKGALATERPVTPSGTAAVPPQDAAPSPIATSAAAAPPPAVPYPVATTTPPTSPAPGMTASQYRRENRIKQRSRRRGPDPAERQ